MWKILFIISIWQISTGSEISADFEMSLEPLLRNIESSQRQIDEDLYKTAYSYFIPGNRLDKDTKYDEEVELQPNQSKRGFTLLARWRPFNNIGKNRASIREHNSKLKTLLDQDVVMETRAHSRPVGQPLRWGK